jgi:hypothetical protein
MSCHTERSPDVLSDPPKAESRRISRDEVEVSIKVLYSLRLRSRKTLTALRLTNSFLFGQPLGGGLECTL